MVNPTPSFPPYSISVCSNPNLMLVGVMFNNVEFLKFYAMKSLLP